jgi:hypothetical protein
MSTAHFRFRGRAQFKRSLPAINAMILRSWPQDVNRRILSGTGPYLRFFPLGLPLRFEPEGLLL